MKILILSFSANQVNEDSFIPNKIGLTFSCVEECEKHLKALKMEYEHICINKKNIKKCLACGKRGWGICLDEHICIQKILMRFTNIWKTLMRMYSLHQYIFMK